MAETTLSQSPSSQTEPEPTRQSAVFQPRFDIVENEHELTLYGDLPGVDQDDLDIRYENEQLIVRGHVGKRNEGLESLRREYEIGDFYRVFAIGESIDSASINAEVHNGVLVVHLPKAESAKPKRISVKSV